MERHKIRGMDRKTITLFDAVLISTAHSAINYQELADWSPLIIDIRNAMNKSETKKEANLESLVSSLIQLST